MSITLPRTIAVTREQLLAYAAASGDDNPIHRSDDAARAIGLPGVIAHGMWTMGAVVSVLDRPVVSVRCRFSAPLVVGVDGATLVVDGTVEGDRASLTGTADGQTVVTVEVVCG